jgi:phosphatidylglycerol---prolipoprotein diacylglyceryl transferase
MFPVLFEIGNFQVTTFGLMMFLSFLSAAWLTGLQLERFGMSREIAWDLLAWVAIGGIVGAKTYYLLLNWDALVADPVGQILSRGGLVWYGGLIGGIISYYVQVRSRKLPVGLMFDATAPALAFAYAVGRLGCFLVGDDYGRPTDSWVGIAFPEGAPPSTAGYFRSIGEYVPAQLADDVVLRVHPTQLYEIGLALIMFAILWRLAHPARTFRVGQLFAVYMMLYAVERFLIEFVRAKTDRVLFDLLTTSQVMSIILVTAGVYLFFRQKQYGALWPVPAAGPARASGKGRKPTARPG